MKEGILIIDKPSGITSHDVVTFVRRKLNIKRVGHAGTLDPLATGVLVVLVGQATKLFNQFVSFDKAYLATLKLGTTTTTADIEGKLIAEQSCQHINPEQIEKAFSQFVGVLDQLPPMVSAVKVKGQRLYKLARSGIQVQREPRRVRVDRLEIQEVVLPYVKFYLECSKGTYVRTLAEDIGETLGCGACISQIQRTRVGPFFIHEAISLEEFDEGYIRPWPKA